MTSCCVLMLNMGEEVDVTAHHSAREAFEYAVEHIRDLYPRERIQSMDDLREFEEEHGFVFEFRGLNQATLGTVEL